MPHIAILAHRADRFESSGYFLRAVIDVWRKQGIHVTVVCAPEELCVADLAILHIDLTVVPEEHLQFSTSFPRVLNGAVTDISKRRLSANLVSPGDGYLGPVVVKTNLNCGGQREARLQDNGQAWAQLVRPLERLAPWHRRGRMTSSCYRVFDCPARVPRSVWSNPVWVVERFLPERRGDLYCLRTWTFLGDREMNSMCCAREPIIKSSNIVSREPVAEVPDQLRRMRRELGFDYGKFDYVIVDGQVILYDANRTPSLGAFPSQDMAPRIRHLAEGLQVFLRQERQPASCRPTACRSSASRP